VRLLHLQRQLLRQRATHWVCLLLLLRLAMLALRQLLPCLPRLVLRCLLLHLRPAVAACLEAQLQHLLLHQLHLPSRQGAV
jgi:hypothetical protein